MKVVNVAEKKHVVLTELDNNSICLVNGGFGVPGAIVGGITGGVAYATEKLVSGGKMTLAGGISAAGVGALGGFVGGHMSIARSIWAIDVAIGGATLIGTVNAMESKQDTSYWSDFSGDSSTYN